jgi:hypothetical protein
MDHVGNCAARDRCSGLRIDGWTWLGAPGAGDYQESRPPRARRRPSRAGRDAADQPGGDPASAAGSPGRYRQRRARRQRAPRRFLARGLYAGHALRRPALHFRQIALDLNTSELKGTTIEEQTRQIMENIRTILEAHRLTMANVVSVTVYMKDLHEFRGMDRPTRPFSAARSRRGRSLGGGPDTARCQGRNRVIAGR